MNKVIIKYTGVTAYIILVVPVLMYALINNCITTIFDFILYFSYFYFAYSISNKLSNWIKRKYNQ